MNYFTILSSLLILIKLMKSVPINFNTIGKNPNVIEYNNYLFIVYCSNNFSVYDGENYYYFYNENIKTEKILILPNEKLMLIGKNRTYLYYTIYDFSTIENKIKGINIEGNNLTSDYYIININYELENIDQFNVKYFEENKILFYIKVNNVNCHYKIFLYNYTNNNSNINFIYNISDTESFNNSNIQCEKYLSNYIFCAYQIYKNNNYTIQYLLLNDQFQTLPLKVPSERRLTHFQLHKSIEDNYYVLCYRNISGPKECIYLRIFYYNSSYEILIKYKQILLDSEVIPFINIKSIENTLFISILEKGELMYNYLYSFDLNLQYHTFNFNNNNNLEAYDSIYYSDYIYFYYYNNTLENISSSFIQLKYYEMKPCNNLIYNKNLNISSYLNFNTNNTLNTSVFFYNVHKNLNISISNFTIDIKYAYDYSNNFLLNYSDTENYFYYYLLDNNEKIYSYMCKITLIKCYEKCKECIKPGSEEYQYCSSCLQPFKPFNMFDVDSKTYYYNCYLENELNYYYYNSTVSYFKRCINNCIKCNSDGKCLICDKNYFLKDDDNNSSCNLVNIEGYYLNLENNLLSRCNSNKYFCNTCFGAGNNTNHNCKTCISGYKIYEFDNNNCKIDKSLCNNYYILKSISNEIECIDNCNGYYSINVTKYNKLCVEDCNTFIDVDKYGAESVLHYYYYIDNNSKTICVPKSKCDNIEYINEKLYCLMINNKTDSQVSSSSHIHYDSHDSHDSPDSPDSSSSKNKNNSSSYKDNKSTSSSKSKSKSKSDIEHDDSDSANNIDNIEINKDNVQIFKLFDRNIYFNKYEIYKNIYNIKEISIYLSTLKNEKKYYNEIDLITLVKEIDFSVIIYKYNFNNKYNNYFENYNLTFIDFSNLFTNFRRLNNESSILILQIDAIRNNEFTNQTEYIFYYFNETNYKLDKIDLLNYSNINITHYYRIKNINKVQEIILQGYKNDINFFDINHPFFNDICFTYTNKNGKDVTIMDRRKNYFLNKTLCENNCSLERIDYDKMISVCNCNLKQNFSNIIENNYENFINEKNVPNIKALSCSNEVLKIDNLKKNKIFFISFFILLFQFLNLIWCCCVGTSFLETYINKQSNINISQDKNEIFMKKKLKTRNDIIISNKIKKNQNMKLSLINEKLDKSNIINENINLLNSKRNINNSTSFMFQNNNHSNPPKKQTITTNNENIKNNNSSVITNDMININEDHVLSENINENKKIENEINNSTIGMEEAYISQVKFNNFMNINQDDILTNNYIKKSKRNKYNFCNIKNSILETTQELKFGNKRSNSFENDIQNLNFSLISELNDKYYNLNSVNKNYFKKYNSVFLPNYKNKLKRKNLALYEEESSYRDLNKNNNNMYLFNNKSNLFLNPDEIEYFKKTQKNNKFIFKLFRYFKKREILLLALTNETEYYPSYAFWSLFLCIITLIFSLHCLLFTNNYIHERFIYENNLSFGYFFSNELGKCVLVGLISVILKMLLIKLLIFKLFNFKENNNNNKNKKHILTKLGTKLVLFFFVIICISILCIYINISYGGIFKNNTSSLIYGLIFSYFFSFIFCLIICIIITLLSKVEECCDLEIINYIRHILKIVY